MQVGKLYRMTLDVGFLSQPDGLAVSLKKHDVVMYLGSQGKTPKEALGAGWWIHSWLSPAGQVVHRYWSTATVWHECTHWFKPISCR